MLNIHRNARLYDEHNHLVERVEGRSLDFRCFSWGVTPRSGCVGGFLFMHMSQKTSLSPFSFPPYSLLLLTSVSPSSQFRCPNFETTAAERACSVGSPFFKFFFIVCHFFNTFIMFFIRICCQYPSVPLHPITVFFLFHFHLFIYCGCILLRLLSVSSSTGNSIIPTNVLWCFMTFTDGFIISSLRMTG